MIDISQNNKKLYSPVDLAINPVFNAIQKDGALSSERSLFDNLIYNFVEVMDSFYSFNISMAHFVLVNKGLFIVQGLISLAIAILVLFGKRDPKTNKLELNIRANLTNLSASSYEVIGFTSCFLFTLFFYLFSAFSNDDSYELVILLIGTLVIGCIVGFLFGFFGPKGAYGLSPSSVGEQAKRLSFMDLVNFGLCFVRVLTCWVRFILYDLQVEHIDMALQYSEDIEVIYDSSLGLINIIFLVLNSLLDIIFLFFQIYITLFKIFIASFLMWLIIDLFLLRSYANKNEDWLLRSLSLKK